MLGCVDAGTHETGHAMDVAGHVLRARRQADLSQRELAEAVGVSHSTIARIEAGHLDPSVDLFGRIIAIGGLRVAVVDDVGVEARPVPEDVVRDNAGRRFPAHLDVQPPDLVPPARWQFPRYDRKPPRAWYHRRAQRDVLRDGASPAGVGDHPTLDELEARRIFLREARRRAAARARQRRRPDPASAPGVTAGAAGSNPHECQCDTPCWISRSCVENCACQCEPAARPRVS